MRISSRFSSIALCTVLVATLAACGTMAPPQQPVSSYPNTYPQTTYPQNTYPQTTYPQTAPGYSEFGRITNIEYTPATSASNTSPNARNALIGGVIGAVVGNVVGKNSNDGKNRTGATVIGGAAGAAIGSQVGKTETANNTNAAYRVTIQTDAGVPRVYEVPGTGDLRVGDRVRVENGVIYRS